MVDFEKLSRPDGLSEQERRAMVRESPPPPPVWLADLGRIERAGKLWDLVKLIGNGLITHEVEVTDTPGMIAAIDEVCRRWLARPSFNPTSPR